MRRAAPLALLLFGIACSVHETPECLPPCDALDVELFAACVAEGLDGVCLAGNRRCCALEAGCLGELDDQTVRTTDAMCEVAEEDTCWPPCTADDVSEYEICLLKGSSLCAVDDDTCCALALDCLGDLGDITVYADGCCATSDECARGQTCDLMTYTCVAGTMPVMCGGDPFACDDGDPCTRDICLSDMGCISLTIDDDDDGYGPGPTCGDDCDDMDSDTYLDAEELCDGVDNDCDRIMDEDCFST